MVFQNYLLRLGELGGKQAADVLRKSISIWYRSTLELSENVQIAVRIYANVKGLAEVCRRANIVSSPEIIEDFFRGFTQGDDLFNFIDVGPGKDRADTKMKGLFLMDLC